MDLTTKFRAERYGSLLVALLICCKMINSAIAMIYSGTLQTGLITMGLIWVAFISYYVRFFTTRINPKALLFLMPILIAFIVSIENVAGHAVQLCMNFVEYGLLGFLLAGVEFRFDKVVANVNKCLLVLFLPALMVVQRNINRVGLLEMSDTYVLMPIAMLALSQFVFYRRQVKGIYIITNLMAAVLLGYIVVMGTRGAVVCVAVFLMLALINSSRFRKGVTLYKAVFYSALLILVVNYETVLLAIGSFLKTMDIEVEFIEKTIVLLSRDSGDISNGRGVLYTLALDDFMAAPLFGNGIGYFPSKYGINYPHNLVLQVLAEGGLFLGIPILGVLAFIFYKVGASYIRASHWRNCIVAITSCTVPAAFFSDELWNYPLLWFLFGVILKKDILIAQPDEQTP